MTWNLVYKLYIPRLISSVNFIEIGQVLFKYGQVKVSNPLKLISNEYKVIYKQCIRQWKEAPSQMKRCKSLHPLTVIYYHLIAT